MSSEKQFDRIIWNEYSSGLVYLDNHRRNFIDIVNELIEVVNEGSCETSLPLIFHRLAFYVEDYFVKKEIALMGNNDLPLQTYKKEHDRFTNEVTRLHEEYFHGNPEVCRELLEFIIPWYKNYIKIFDTKAIEYLKKKGFE